MILLIDNYDSFSYNLYQLIGKIEPNIRVIRNDEMTVPEIEALAPEKIILSPGPGRPENAGILIEAVKVLGPKIPLLGVCLGHQAICEVYGAVIAPAEKLMHGKKSRITLAADCELFAGLGREMDAARYHSLAAKAETVPETLRVTAVSPEGEVMAVQHKDFPVYGLQFHPESILTPLGKDILAGFLKHTAPAASALPGAHTTPQEGEPA